MRNAAKITTHCLKSVALICRIPTKFYGDSRIFASDAFSLLAGATLTETVFSIAGIGRLTVDAVSQRDYPLIQGCILVLAFTFVVVNTLVDVLYTVADPRIKFD